MKKDKQVLSATHKKVSLPKWALEQQRPKKYAGSSKFKVSSGGATSSNAESWELQITQKPFNSTLIQNLWHTGYSVTLFLFPQYLQDLPQESSLWQIMF